MLLLMVVAFMPFATALMSSNALARVPELFYASTLLAAGLLQRLLFARALQPPFIRPGISPEDIAATRWRSLGLPSAAATSLVAAWFVPGWNNFLLLGIPLLVRAYAGLGRRRAQRVQAAPAQS
jgi:uncharacterized membrane protein